MADEGRLTTGSRGVGQRIEVTAKLVTLLLGAAYAVGLVVVNLHLLRYGYFSISLLHAHYVVAGIWFLLPLALAAVLLEGFLALAARRFGLAAVVALVALGGGWLVVGLGARTAVVFLTAFSVAMAVRAPLLDLERERLEAEIARVRREVAAPPAPDGPRAGGDDGREAEKRTPRRTRRADPLPVTLAVFLLFSLLYTVSFDRLLYARIPVTLGGGRPGTVRIIPIDAARPALRAAGLAFPDDGPVSAPLGLLFATSEVYVLIPGSGARLLELRRSLTDVLVYERDSTWSRDGEWGQEPSAAPGS